MNNIGIENDLDWPRIRHLLKLGLIASFLSAVADFLLGWAVPDESLTGVERYLSAFTQISDGRLFWSALLGMVFLLVTGLCFFAVYRLMADKAPGYAHAYRCGIFGWLIFAPCGFHVPCLMACYFYKHLLEIAPEQATPIMKNFALYFMLPALICLWISWVVLEVVQLQAFRKGLTPYPKWCWVFNPAFAVIVMLCTAPFDHSALANAIGAAWVNIGNMWMFGGLLMMSKKTNGRLGAEK